ncbi:MAG: porin [Planctomycetaceae bacterium]
MLKRTWKSWLATTAMVCGLATGTTYASDGCCAPTTASACCQQCDQIFADAGQKLSDQLASMSCCNAASCCAPPAVSCCAPSACGDPCSLDSCIADACGEAGCGDGCGEGCDSLFGECGSGITIGGWAQFGYHSGVTPLSTVRNQGLAFNDHPHRLNLHQGWLYAEKIADGSNGLDWGFRADFMYGVDASSTQAFGNNPGRFDFQNGWDRGAGYGWALPQLYAEVAAGDVSVKIGHFYTLVGYEVVTAPGNFFYSHALTMYNSEPFTHTGAIATYNASDELTLYGGWTAGWDTGFDRFNSGSNFLGGFSSSLTEDVTLTYINTVGNLGWRGHGYSHSIVVDTAVNDKLNYVLQSDVVRAGAYDTIGINNYLFYTLTDNVKAGTRVEWWKADGFSRYEATWGVNVTPMENLVVRPEVRYDWGADPNNGGADLTTTTFGIDAILSF